MFLHIEEEFSYKSNEGIKDVSTGKSFECSSETTVDGFTGFHATNMTEMQTWNVHVEAFRTGNSDKFADCKKLLCGFHIVFDT